MIGQPDLSDRHMGIVRRVLREHPGLYERAAVFGSRATGQARPNSDLDLVIRGKVESLLLAEIRMGFEESLLPLKVDVLAYDQITSDELRQHIDRVAVPLPLAPDTLDEGVSAAAG